MDNGSWGTISMKHGVEEERQRANTDSTMEMINRWV